MKAALCDDNCKFTEVFEQAFSRCLCKLEIDIELFCFTNSCDLLNELEKEQYELLFLDIEMPTVNGFELAKIVNDKGINCKIIFVSQWNDWVFDSFLYRPIGFIRKKFLMPELSIYLQEFWSRYAMDELIEINSIKEHFYIHTSEITYIESNRNYIIFHLEAGNTHRIRGNLKVWEEKLGSLFFVRIYSSYIVNCKYIYSIHGDSAIMDDGSKLNIRRDRMKNLKKQYSSYLVGKDKNI